MIRRVRDTLLAAALLVACAPVFLVIALALWLEGAGPVFERSVRLGAGGRRFTLLWFRTARRGEPTLVGQLIRARGFDGLPALINVLRGDLSLVGPCPATPGEVDADEPGWQQLTAARPGLFSPAAVQLAAVYPSSSQAVRQVLELEYLETRTLSSDIAVLRLALRAPQHRRAVEYI